MRHFQEARQSAGNAGVLAATDSPGARWRRDFLSNPAGEAWEHWRAAKLAGAQDFLACAPVRIADANHVSQAEHAALRAQIALVNVALYQWETAPTDSETLDRALLDFAGAFGLRALEDHRSANGNGVVRIEAVDGARGGYIPYTNRRIAWHTDGYYNYSGPARSVQAMILHCAAVADEGGENRLLDHELAFLRLADSDVSALRLLLHPQAMVIPEARDEAGRVRPENRGPVFFLGASGALSMRYTARRKNVVWRDEATRDAAAALLALIESEPLVRRERLRPGQGLLCNNVLHDRAAFHNGAASRLLCRVRFHNRIESEF